MCLLQKKGLATRVHNDRPDGRKYAVIQDKARNGVLENNLTIVSKPLPSLDMAGRVEAEESIIMRNNNKNNIDTNINNNSNYTKNKSDNNSDIAIKNNEGSMHEATVPSRSTGLGLLTFIRNKVCLSSFMNISSSSYIH